MSAQFSANVMIPRSGIYYALQGLQDLHLCVVLKTALINVCPSLPEQKARGGKEIEMKMGLFSHMPTL